MVKLYEVQELVSPAYWMSGKDKSLFGVVLREQRVEYSINNTFTYLEAFCCKDQQRNEVLCGGECRIERLVCVNVLLGTETRALLFY